MEIMFISGCPLQCPGAMSSLGCWGNTCLPRGKLQIPGTPKIMGQCKIVIGVSENGGIPKIHGFIITPHSMAMKNE